MNIDVWGVIDIIADLISSEYFLIGSAIVCMIIAVLLVISLKNLVSRLYVLVAGTNLMIQGIHFLGVL